MIWPLGSKTFLEPDIEAWHLETWAWLLKHLGGLEAVRAAPLVLANADFFPPSHATGAERVRELFGHVRRHADMEDLPCALEVQPDYLKPAGQFMVVKTGTTDPAPADAADGEWEGLVTYSPGIADDPVALVATFAHELAHYRLAYVTEPPPGGRELEELATDLTVVFTGFGVFGAAVAMRFKDQALRWMGYLSPRAWIFALAVFLLLRDEQVEPLAAHLDARLYDDLVKAVRYLERNPELLARVLP